jgi:hypothetical protein
VSVFNTSTAQPVSAQLATIGCIKLHWRNCCNFVRCHNTCSSVLQLYHCVLNKFYIFSISCAACVVHWLNAVVMRLSPSLVPYAVNIYIRHNWKEQCGTVTNAWIKSGHSATGCHDTTPRERLNSVCFGNSCSKVCDIAKLVISTQKL